VGACWDEVVTLPQKIRWFCALPWSGRPPLDTARLIELDVLRQCHVRSVTLEFLCFFSEVLRHSCSSLLHATSAFLPPSGADLTMLFVELKCVHHA